MMNRAADNVLPLHLNTSCQFVCLWCPPAFSPQAYKKEEDIILRSSLTIDSVSVLTYKVKLLSQVEPALLLFINSHGDMQEVAAAQRLRALCSAYFCESEGTIAQKIWRAELQQNAINVTSKSLRAVFLIQLLKMNLFNIPKSQFTFLTSLVIQIVFVVHVIF